jgi:hypothetical protein
MKKSDIKELKAVVIPDSGSYIVPDGWQVLKEPVKCTENGIDVLKVVIGRP